MYSSEDRLYCYPDSSTLKNLLDIRDAAALAEAEGYIVGLRMAEVVRRPSNFVFNFEFFKDLHRGLFQDVYTWAGVTRRVDMSKGHTRFAVWEQVEAESERLFNSTVPQPTPNSGGKRQWFIGTAAPFLVEMNVIHPFRDGNGRTTRLFIELWAASIGLQLDWGRVEPEKILEAMIHGVTHDDSLAREVLDVCIVPPPRRKLAT